MRGAEIFACQLSVELKGLGIQSDIGIIFNNNTDKEKSLTKKFDLIFLSIGGTKYKRFYDWHAYKNLSCLIKERKYDLIQANAGDTLKYSVISKKLFSWKQPIVFRNASQITSFIMSFPQKQINKYLIKQCARIISVSASCKCDMTRLCPSMKHRIENIPIGTYDFDDVETNSLSQEIRGHDEPVIINVGSFVHEKNQVFLIKVFESFYKKHNTGFLWIIGDGKLRKVLERLIASLGLENRVKLFGYIEDSIQFIKAADILFMPSKIEGLPGAVLEAMSCSKPVVSSSVAGLPEIVKNDVNGFCLDTFKINDYVLALEKLVLNPGLRKEMGDNGKRIVSDYYQMHRIASLFAESYREILR